jgi:isoleucyl-tRNA synthetase
MRTVRALAEAGRAARKRSDVRVRQPLARALFGVPDGAAPGPELLRELAAELNVKRLEPLTSAGGPVDVRVTPNFRALGKRFGRRTQAVAAAVRAADPAVLAGRLRDGGGASVPVDGEHVVLRADEVAVSEVPRTGWVVESQRVDSQRVDSQRAVTIALDTAITAELAAEGIARDVVRVVQAARRDAGLDVSDRVVVTIGGPPEVLAAVRAHEAFVAGETLADRVELSAATGDGLPVTAAVIPVGPRGDRSDRMTGS